MEREFFDFIDEVFSGIQLANHQLTKFRPRVNVYEQSDGYHVDLFYPGKEKEDFKTQVQKQDGEDILLIESSFSKVGSEVKYFRKEFIDNDFIRKFKLPDNIDKKKISAKYESGILKILLPKDIKKEKESNFEINIS